jgi:alkyl hydroperoxide reductase subunit AhpC
LAELRNLIKEDEKDVVLLAISVDPKENAEKMITRIEKDGKGKINFPLLSDPMHKTIDDYGLFDTRYEGQGVEGIPQPAIYILDKNRKILWANVDPNYRTRPSVETLQMKIESIKNEK